jgi:hypothetical protein
LQRYIEDPLSEALIQGTISTRPAFIEVFLEDNKLYYHPVDSQESVRLQDVLTAEPQSVRIASWNAAGTHSAASATTTIWRMYAQRSPSKAINGIKNKLRPRKLGQKAVASGAGREM